MGVRLEEVLDQCVRGEGAGQMIEGDEVGDVRGARRDMARGTAQGIE
jgi:hypothetical protein